ncbi:MAG: alpha/beta hydrolase [Verrucomicrobia bacterium]|nr:alpha/beta hydrolase [Verrucomicrobiota bacterium]MDA1067849.1 alpha/beta hydrolase [Verrucomicrobiota bacterium]
MKEKRIVHFVVVSLLFVLRANAETPTYSNVAYGEYERNVLDFYQAQSSKPTPLVVFIHGGGFQSFDKDRIDQKFLKEFLSSGISVAAINYRYVQMEPFPSCFHDARRALQFLRSKSDEWNFDPARVGAYGGSAGAMISMWLGFHDDMADPESDDPVLRESTRLTCVATQGGQITFDRHWMEQSIPGNMIHKNPAMTRLFGVRTLDDLDKPEIRKWIKELSPITHLTADDVPVYMEYSMNPSDPIPADPAKIKSWALHHVIFGVTLKIRMDALGLENHLNYPGQESTHRNIPEYFKEKLLR